MPALPIRSPRLLSHLFRSAATALALLLPIVSSFGLKLAYAHMDPAIQMPLGNPDKAAVEPSNRTRYLIQRPQYALSYNNDLRFPNWVAWHLSKQDIGNVERGQFQPDTLLPAGFLRITP